MGWTRVLAGAGLAWVGFASIVGAGGLGAQELVPWREGTVRPKADAGFRWMPAEGGFARQQGLDLKIVPYENDLDLVRALRAGELESVEASPINPMIATSRGGDLKIVGCSWPKLTFSFFSRRGIGSLGELAGKRIGTSEEGSLPDLVARAMLGRIAIEAKDVRFVTLAGEADRVRALTAGTIDATVASSDLAARTEIGLKTLARANDILPSFVRACIVTRGDVWRKRPDHVVSLLGATMVGYQYALGHREETITLARRIAKLPASDPTPAASFEEVAGNRSLSPTFEIEMSKLLWLRDLLAEDGRIDQDFEPGTMIDNSLRERSLARLRGGR
jgi:NitT/TauT family transport system substrate-binding protein